MNRFFTTLIALLCAFSASAQNDNYNQVDANGNISLKNSKKNKTDSLGTEKEIPKGIKVWTVDSRFGDRTPAILDTIPHLFMNSIFTTGLRGEYNTTGNLGAPRINRIFIYRPEDDQFIFTQPYDYIVRPIDTFHFTNTLSPFTNITYNNAGDRTNGEDHFTAKFGANAGKRLGVGINFDYLYGRGYYANQSTSHFNYTMYGSYLGDHYQAHLLMSTNHQKVTENGGITDDNYITHPESFSDNYTSSEIPTVLEQNWNRNDNQHVFFTQRYSLGFRRKVKMTEEEIKIKKFAIESKKENDAQKAKENERKETKKEGKNFDEDAYDRQKNFSGRPNDAKIVGAEPQDGKDGKEGRVAVNGKDRADSLLAASKQAADTTWLKDEYVPVTSFIHTVKFDNYRRIYQAYNTPANYYKHEYYDNGWYTGDSIYDKTRHYRLQNTFAISLLEGFNKWAKAGVKAFITHDLRHFTLPDSLGTENIYNEHNISIGGQLSKTQGNTLHYNAMAETWLAGEDAGQLKIDASTDLNFRFLGDTITMAASGFFYRLNPTFYYRHYHSRHFWWDNDNLSKIIHSRIEGLFSYKKTHTTLRVAVDEIKNYTYLSQSYTITSDHNRTDMKVSMNQSSASISLLTASLSQDFTLGPLNWESVITYQKSTQQDIIPVPDLNIYTNLYLKFKIAHVLSCDFGADMRYFSKYYAPDYSPALGQYTVQTGDYKTEVGNYPIINVYANFHLKHTRFFIMMSHVNSGNGNKDYFLTPHYPLNDRILRMGLSWNFFN